MTVQDLIEELQAIPNPDKVFVMCSCDPEGNAFSPLTEFGVGSIVRATEDLQDISSLDDEDMDEMEASGFPHKAIVIYPS